MRAQRFIDVYNVKEPDRIPVSFPIVALPAYLRGMDYYSVMYDSKKAAEVWAKFSDEHAEDLDTFSSPAIVLPGKVYDLLDYKLYAWPGHGLPREASGFQYVEGEYMRADEYVVTVGIATAIEDTTSFIWGPTVKGVSFSMPAFHIGGVVISPLRVSILILIIGLTIFLHFYLKKTFVGKAIRAILQNREGAIVIGINVPRIITMVFGIAVGLAGVAGVFYVLLFTIGPFIGLPLTIRYIAIVMLGGSGSLLGSLVGGLILGVAETFAGFFLGAHWSLSVAFFTLVLVLLLKPEGLFRHV